MANWTTADIARELGLKSRAVARSFVRDAGLKDVGRDGEAKLYDSDAVLAAKRDMPGKGANLRKGNRSWRP